MDDVVAKITELIAGLNPYNDIFPDLDLFNSNMLDSLKFVVFLQDVEEKFNIEIDPDELVIDNFQTIYSIASFVKRKTTQTEHQDLPQT